MSTMRNSVMLIGRPGAEPEMKNLNNNGKVADRVERLVKKGLLIAIDGSLRNNEWTDDKGQRHYVTEVLINDLFPIEKAKE